MRRRFFAPARQFSQDKNSVTLDREESAHLTRVLRLRTGDAAFVFDGEGREYECRVDDIAGKRGESVTLAVLNQVQPSSPESKLMLTLAVALLKGEKFDLVVQKATELGVTRIAPLLTKRADVRLRDERDGAKRVERLRRIALEAAKQSGRARVPEISQPVEFDQFIAESAVHKDKDLRVLFAERDGKSLREVLTNAETMQSVTAIVGAEGGWETEEIEHAREEGWQIVTLGGRILRAETAAICFVALLQHLYGDLN